MVRRVLSAAAWGVAITLAFALGRDCAEPRVIERTIAVVDTVPPAALLAELDALRKESSGLRARLAGITTREPERIIVTDTLVLPPDTVLVLVTVDAKGRATFGQLIAVHPDSVRRRPEIAYWYDLSDCDDGWLWFDGHMRCDRPVFGHLGLYLGAALARQPLAEVGLEWRPRYRSGWNVTVGLRSDGGAALSVRRAVWLW